MDEVGKDDSVESGSKADRHRASNGLVSRFLSLSRSSQLVLSVVGLMLLLLVWMGLSSVLSVTGPDESDDQALSPQTQPAPLTVAPQMPTGVEATKIFQSLSGVNVLTDNVGRQLERLRQSIEDSVSSSDRAREIDDLLAADFQAAAIDRERFLSRLDDPQIKVSRWSHADSAPVFSGDDAIENFSRSVYEPWLDGDQFRIDLQMYTFDDKGATIRTTVVASAFGAQDKSSSRQATSLWETIWTRPKSTNDLPVLKSLKVVAQEELATQFKGGQLLADCTASILQRCKCLSEQLDYGIDQWARRIPGIDIMGEHGLAIGDINGDGIDDVYVCQPHGLPNLLLIQNPDGTCDELGRNAKVDVLDSSHAALIVDLDNDRDQDLIVSTDENLLIFSNTGKGSFQIEHRLPAGRCARSICAADYDQDGDLDLFLCKFEGVRKRDDLIALPGDLKKANDGGRNVLLRNDEGWQFTDATEEAGITSDNQHFTRSALWSDYDQDGDQDLYVVNEFATDRLYENQQGWFRDVTKSSGIESIARHRSVSCGDFNHDGKSDFYVATDVPFSVQRSFGKVDRDADPRDLKDAVTGESQIWYAQKDSDQWRPFAMRAPLFSNQSAFGSVATDLNNDGLDDIIVTNGTLSRYSTDQVDDMLYRRLFADRNSTGKLRNPSTDSFNPPSESQVAKVIRETTDMCRKGYSFAGRQRNQSYLSIGQLGFANFSAASGVDFMQDGRGIATTDWDHDGDSDVIMTSRNGCRLRILCNQLESENDFLQLTLVGTQSNADAIGARALAFVKDKPHPIIKTVTAGSGYLSQSSKRLSFGLGRNATIEKLTVVWPDGTSQDYTDVRPNLRYRIVEGQGSAAELPFDRMKLRLAAVSHPGRDSLPRVERSLFNPSALVPELTMVEPDGKTYPVLSVSPKSATWVIVVDQRAPSKSLVQSISKMADAWEERGVECIAVTTDVLEADRIDSGTRDSETLSSLPTGSSMMEETKFPFRWGAATQDTKTRIALWCGNIFGSQQMPQAPFGMLFNADRKAVVFYSADQIGDAELLADATLVELNTEKVWNKVMPFEGRWFAPYRFSVADRMTIRLAELGHQDAAKLLHEASAPYRAYEFAAKGFELLSADNPGLAKQFFRNAVKADSESAWSRIGVAKVLRREASQLLGNESKTNEKRSELREKAIINFEYAMELDPTSVEAIVGRANVAIDSGQIPEAVRLLKRFVKLQPGKYEIHAIIGRLLFQQNKTAEAAQWLVEVFEKRPTLPYVAGDLGFLYLNVGEHRQAVPFLELANRLQPSDQNVHRLLSEAYYLTGKYDQCVKWCERVIAQDPNRQRPAYLLAWVLATAPFESLRDPDRAIEVMEPAMKIFGDKSASTNEIFAAIMAEKKDFDEAIRYQNKAISLIREKKSTERYSDAQLKGLRNRSQLYERGKPYRMSEPIETPLGAPGVSK